LGVVVSACGGPAAASQASGTPATPAEPRAQGSVADSTPQGSPPAAVATDSSARGALQPVASAPAACSPGDFSDRALPPLLEPGKDKRAARPDRASSEKLLFDAECTDSPVGVRPASMNPTLVDGLEIRLLSAEPAGVSGRGWQGNQCTFGVRLADGTGAPVQLGPAQVPPHNTIASVVRDGTLAWLSISFNGYTKEFPKGGNRIIALDLCAGKVAWQSSDVMSNGGLLLLGDYLISPFGFTKERRYVYVLDAHSGKVVQKLQVLENVCPSKSWAPNWKAGDPCDRPGQLVGAARAPRVEEGLFLVDTNIGSAAFQFK